MSRPYYEAVVDLANVYLEDSYVLGIHEGGAGLFFDLEVVLTEHHPLYQTPAEDMRYCYRTARLSFVGNLKVNWIERNLNARNVDPDGSVDLGQIDGFECDTDGYHIDGEWGAVKIACDEVRLAYR